MEKFNLSSEELKEFVKIKNSYGNGGAFFGMCMNQSFDNDLDFEIVLKRNLIIQGRLDKTLEEADKGVVVNHSKTKVSE